MTDEAPAWSVVVTAGAARSLQQLPEKSATAIVEFLTGALQTNPLRLSKPVRYELEGWRTARRGDYRVTLRLDAVNRTIIVGRIEHRRDVYRPRERRGHINLSVLARRPATTLAGVPDAMSQRRRGRHTLGLRLPTAGSPHERVTMLSDGEIANAAHLLPITQVARESLGLDEQVLVPYGHDKAKIDLAYAVSLTPRPGSRLVLVTALSPTPAGEGKTTTVIGLTDALRLLGTRAAAALREPSMGPVFGMKGGAAGGGYAQVVPMTEINLHFTGDFAAIEAANNLLAALIDNHVHHGNPLDIDVRSVTWKRAVDLNDRALRQVVVGLGGPTNGYPREDGFDIVVASELMAIFCLADSLADLKERIGNIVVAHTRSKEPVRARDLVAEGAMTVLLRQAFAPNLVQTLEHSPAFIHGGPFANIAHGCNSVIATRTALGLADVVVTEAGFGADLGAEKFLDLMCRSSGLRPDVAVVVVTVRALKYHGGVAVADLQTEDLEAIDHGALNLERHLTTLRDVFGLPVVVAVNRFPSDTPAELERVEQLTAGLGFTAYVTTHVADGGRGAMELARGVLDVLDGPQPSTFRFAYEDSGTVEDKVTVLATRVYGAAGVTFSARARRQLAQVRADGFGHLPVCVAKTQYSFSTDPTALGAPTGHVIDVREVRLCAGAGFIVLITGDVMTMPGLPRHPASERIDIDAAGLVTGLS